MITIKTGDKNSEDYKLLQDWITEEWPNSDTHPMTDEEDDLLPLPLLAYDEDRLIGGLTFTFFPEPQLQVDPKNQDETRIIEGDKTIWINAVYVMEIYRNNKVGQKLIAQAEMVLLDYSMKNPSFKKAFVYTDKPSLYTKLGWSEYAKQAKDTIMVFSLKNLRDKAIKEGDHTSLKTVYVTNSEVELNMLTALLNDNGVNTQFQEKGIGEYMRIISGYNAIGSEIRVLETDYNRALEILEAFWSDGSDDKDYRDENSLSHYVEIDKAAYHKRKIMRYAFVGILLLIYVVPALVAFIFQALGYGQ